MDKGFIGRQPIYREGVDVCAYELSSHQTEPNRTAVNELLDVGLERVAGPHPAFVPVTRDFVVSDYCSALPRKSVLQVAGDTVADDSFLSALARLSTHGFSIAVDNVACSDKFQPLAEIADIVKIDVGSLDRATISQHVQTLRPFKVKLLAQRVETYDDYQYCKDQGFEYFEGYFFCNPQLSNKNPLPYNRQSTLHLLSKLQNPEISLNELEQAVGQDVAMSY